MPNACSSIVLLFALKNGSLCLIWRMEVCFIDHKKVISLSFRANDWYMPVIQPSRCRPSTKGGATKEGLKKKDKQQGARFIQ
ncbi:hypothetical protein BKA61DRAFT_594515 [Leptodontidium sp. MPI-SDFR-AT-0119]|nr:hypothetical protein BKA61DRAFT_594515 [Leptodontidium sp. MPI-SDFR-AT-0119]